MSDHPSNLPLTGRRKLLGALGALGAVGIAGPMAATQARAQTTSPRSAAAGSCVVTAQETQGPYPLLAVLSNTAIVRKDITEGKAGVPLTLNLVLQNVNDDCKPIVNAAVYIWHCDKDGVYSGYSQPGTNTVGQTFLRGIQVSDADGKVSFTTVYPGWYTGRITHIHAQIYLSDNLSVTAVATTQFAFPSDITSTVYASSLYAAHGQNTSVASFAQDNVFSDGTSTEMLALAGDVASGYAATLTLGIAGVSAGTTSDIDRLFNWAQVAYSSLFQPASTATQSGGGYVYRYFASTQTYLGVRDGRVYYLAPGMAQPQDVGAFTTYFAQAAAAGY